MQQPGQMFPVTPSFPPNITAEQIRKYLDENQKLILGILDNQTLRKLAKCARPQTPGMSPQMVPQPAMQQGGFYMQQPQVAGIGQQPGILPQRASLQFNNLHQMPDQQQHLYQHHHPQPQAMRGHMGMRPARSSNGMHPTNNEATLGGNDLVLNSGIADIRGRSKQDNLAERSSGADGQETSAAFGGGDRGS